MNKIRLMLTIVVIFPILLMGCNNNITIDDLPYLEGEIQEKYFQKGESTSGIGIAPTGAAILTATTTSDTYTIFVNNTDFQVQKETWLALEKGQKIRYKIYYGNIKEIEIME